MMQKIILKIAVCLCALAFVTSCDLNEIDNYDSPDASIRGGIYDNETGALVEQDIIVGMQIEYVEQGFDNPETQYQVVKNDGTFQNKMMFSGKYTMQPVRGNFVPQDKIDVDVKGDTEVNFKVQPYIRIKNAKIEKTNGKFVATFSIQQTVTNNVKTIALFAHKEMNVGDQLSLVSEKLDINGQTAEATVYTLTIDPAAHKVMTAGAKFYFRIGAQIDAPEAKYNYLPAQRFDI